MTIIVHSTRLAKTPNPEKLLFEFTFEDGLQVYCELTIEAAIELHRQLSELVEAKTDK